MRPQDEAEEAFDFRELGVHMLDIRGANEQHPLKCIPADTDGVLLLKPLGTNSGYESLYFEAEAPVVARLEASWATAGRVLQTVVNSVGLAKTGDAVCVTSSWARRWFADRLPRSDHIHNIPAAPASVSSALASEAAREAVTGLLKWDEIGSRPLVGFLTSGERGQLASLAELARLRPD